MKKKFSGKETKFMVMVLFLSAVIGVSSSLAATEFIEEDEGGIINIDYGIDLIIPPDALDEDMYISADMIMTDDKINFVFSPSPTEFDEPLFLVIHYKVFMSWGLDSYALYDPDGEKINPWFNNRSLCWSIPHFSVYYHRRR